MSKKFGKFLLFSAMAGAAAYGAYYYLQSKEKAPVDVKSDDNEDDFDDFGEDLDEDIVSPVKERSYVSLNLDKAEAFASEAFHKAKEVIADSVAQVKETVKSVAETQSVSNGSFTDITNLNKDDEEEETPVAEEVSEEPQATAEEEKTEEPASPNLGEHTVEEFFDDETP